MSKKDFRHRNFSSVQEFKTKCHWIENISGAISLEYCKATYPKITLYNNRKKSILG